ncbi:hypothetical protein D3C80_949360 [compost metagenome]
MSKVPFVGAITSPNNSSIAMTVHALHRAEGTDAVQVEAVYFEGGKVHHFYGDTDAFVGFGDSLVFSGGAFQYAFNSEEEDEDDEEEEDEELEQEDEAPAAPVA